MAYIKLEDLQKFPIRKDHYDKEHSNEDFIFGIETVLEYAEYLPTYPASSMSEWISVDVRFPDLFNTVLVYDTHTECVRISLYRGPEEIWCNGRISHWMPFPEPPKMKGGE